MNSPSVLSDRYSDYDQFAWFYNRHWGNSFTPRVLPILERLVLPHVSDKGSILDLCCGTGQLANALHGKGYAVTGIDSSEEMLRLARENAPGVRFFCADARRFELPDRFQAVLSHFDSLNHVMEIEELKQVFGRVHAVLAKDGEFFFDLNMEEGFKVRWKNQSSIVDEQSVCLMRPAYSPEERTASLDLTLFQRINQHWARTDLRLTQRAYMVDEIRSALKAAGFSRIEEYDSSADLVSREIGRMFFRAKQ